MWGDSGGGSYSGTQLSLVSDVRIAKDYKLLRIISRMISGLVLKYLKGERLVIQ